MIQIQNLHLELGGKILFKEVSCIFNKHDKVGLVGRNGAGKSTLLKVIARQQGIDDGAVSVEKGRKLAYLPQEVVLLSEKTVLNEAMTTFDDVYKRKEELEVLEKYLEQTDSKELDQSKLDRYAQLQQELMDTNIDALEAQAKQVLTGLGFTEQQLEQRVDQLSVGWRMRLVLAKLLLKKADFYLFDEPTNHLDIVAKEWFIEFLQQANFGFLLVSHDRYFLDHLCKSVFALEEGNGKLYRGNYSKYLEQREEDRARQEVAYQTQQKELKQKMKTIERFRAKATKAKMVKSMIKSLDKIEKIEAVSSTPKEIKMSFGNIERAGRVVLKVDKVSKTFDQRTIFKNASLELFRGDKAAIIAPNGKGKTTLLNLLTKKYPLEEGTFSFGHNVQHAFFEQDQDKLLMPANTVLQEAETACSTTEQRQKVRTLLGTFLFPGDDVDKKIRVLSGGERNRVAMVKVLLQDANVLILDEPTNHLDIQSKEILLKALQQYPGTVLFVSHDRTFLNGLATKIYDLTEAGIVTYEGNYDSYLYQKKQKELDKLGLTEKKQQKTVNQKQTEQKKQASTTSKHSYEENKKIRSLERKIEKLEAELEDLNLKFETLEFGTQAFDDASLRIKEVQKLLEDTYAQWEAMQ